MNIGDIFFALRGEGDQLVVDAQKAAEAAGAKGGQSFAAAFKKNGITAAAAAIGAATGAILSEAGELGGAFRQLKTDTGMVGAEADAAKHSMIGMYRDTLAGFDEIGAAMARVHTDLHATGTEADDLTRRFIKFAEVTGGTAADEVGALRDILNAFNLDASHTSEVMDLLIASHERYGGVLSEDEANLAALGPAFNAVGLSIVDGIGLLNMFKEAGVDASTGATALTKALGTVKSPAELKRLIADIAATTDPFVRAQKAADLFGAKAGPKLAQALSQGNLDEFTISMNEAAGATDKAAATAESGFGNQFTLMLKNATGAVIEFGNSFGSYFDMAAAVAGKFGPKMAGAIGAGLGGLSGVLSKKIVASFVSSTPAVVAAATAQGAEAGAAEGAAAGTAAGMSLKSKIAALGVLAIPVAIAIVGLDVAFQDLQNRLNENNKLAEQKLTEAEIRAYKWSKFTDADRMNAARHGFGKPENYEADLKSAIEKMNAAAAAAVADGKDGIDKATNTAFGDMPKNVGNTGEQAIDALSAAIKAGTPEVLGASLEAVDAMVAALDNMSPEARAAGGVTVQSLADGLRGARDAVTAAWDQLGKDQKSAMDKTTEIAKLSGMLTSKQLAAGMESSDSVVRAQAAATRDAILGRLRELDPNATTIGKATTDALNRGLRSKDPQVRANAEALKAIIEGKLSPTGTDSGNAIVDGLTGALTDPAAIKSLTDAMILWRDIIAGKLKGIAVNPYVGFTINTGGGSTPPPKSSPPPKTMKPLAAGMPYVAYDMPAYIHRGEAVLTVPQAEAWRGGKARGDLTVIVNNPKQEPASTSVRRELGKLSITGAW